MKPAKTCYSVCETTTHYFLAYAAYHVLDWWKRFDPDNLYDFLRDLVGEHVHDMEGALLVVTKAPDLLIDGVVTVAHCNDNVFMQKESGQWGFVYREKNGGLKGGAANPPWSWNHHNDTSPIGEIATDPARFIIRYAQGWGPVSTHYIYNPYLSI